MVLLVRLILFSIVYVYLNGLVDEHYEYLIKYILYILQCRHDLRLSFEESVFGGKREIEISCYETCNTCDGTGAKSKNGIKKCTSCGGKGGEKKTQRTPFGMMSQVI